MILPKSSRSLSLSLIRTSLVCVIAFSAAFASAQAPAIPEVKAFLSILKKIREKAEAGVAVTYLSVDESSDQRTLARYSMMGSNQRLDEVVYEIRDGREFTLYASTHFQREQANGSSLLESGAYQDVEGKSAKVVLESLDSDNQPRILRSNTKKDVLFSHLAWRYGRGTNGWISESILKAKEIEVKKNGAIHRISFDQGVEHRLHLTVEDSVNSRVIKQSGRPKTESARALLGSDFFETSERGLAFTRTADYSRFPEHVLRREDTASHKVPRGRDDMRTDYTIVTETFAPLEESFFDYKQAAKKGSSNGRQTIAFSQIGNEGEEKPASQVRTMQWIRRGFIVFGLIAAGIYYLKNYLSRSRQPKE